MKISYSNNQLFDAVGFPLVNGRVSFYLHDSDTLATIYTLEGQDFVQATNPVILDNSGAFPSTVFMEAAIYDVVVERYENGAYVSMYDTEYGFTAPDSKNDTVVFGIEGLQEANTSLSYVTVVGYDDIAYAGPRMYIWDEHCTEAADGGCIIESNVSSRGRWLLLSDLREMPSTYYGVIPGNEANLSAFITYQPVVGTYGIYMPPIPRFISGVYSSEGTFSTTKTLSFDSGAQFSIASIVCRSVEITANTGFVADFIFNYREVVAHSSWFRSIESFLTCGANTLVVDNADNFLYKTLSLPTNVSNATIVFSSNTRLPITYMNTGRLGLSRVNLVGSAMFNDTDKIAFSYMDIHDEWWQSPTSVDWLNKVSARSTSNNVLRLSNFRYVHAYIDAVKANGETSLDLSGRYVSSFTDTSFTDLRNISCGRLEINMSGQDVYMHNVKSENCEVLCHFLVCDDNCDIRFAEAEPVVNAAWFTDSSIHGGTTWFQNTYYEFKRCAVSVTFHRVSNNEDGENGLFFEDCQLLENCVIESKALTMKHCTTLNNTIKIYPYYDSDKSMYRMSVTLEGNLFTNANPIEFTRVETDERCTDIRVNWYIVGNTFAGNNEGLRCRYWQNRLGTNPNSVFIYRGDYNESSVTYKGNLGLCPSCSGVGLHCNDLAISEWYIHTVGDTKYSYFIANWGFQRLMPNVREAGFGYSLFYLGTKSVDDDEFGVKTFDGADKRIERATLYMYPQSSLVDSDSNGDFFKHSLCMIEEITQAAPNDVHQWRYLT
ncbi:MAG: hypothetical protein J6T78_04145 [Bacteroidaceae bacterium]|nr:hypothetical protein [Bacteroidaceae bacterium]